METGSSTLEFSNTSVGFLFADIRLPTRSIPVHSLIVTSRPFASTSADAAGNRAVLRERVVEPVSRHSESRRFGRCIFQEIANHLEGFAVRKNRRH